MDPSQSPMDRLRQRVEAAKKAHSKYGRCHHCGKQAASPDPADPSLDICNQCRYGVIDRACVECGKNFRAQNIPSLQRCAACRRPPAVRMRMNARSHARRRRYVLEDPDLNWRTLVERDGLECWYCGIECDPTDTWTEDGRDGRPFVRVGPTHPTLDHFIPVSQGGTHTLDNAVLACNQCNGGRCDSDAETYRAKKRGLTA